MGEGVLDQLLDADLACDPITVDQLTNHRPMALIALAALGADDARLRDFSERYTPRTAAIRGDVAQRTLALADEADRVGATVLLDEKLPPLVHTIGGGAFHGLIRLGYAVEHGRGRDIASGLVYLHDAAVPVLVPTSGAAPHGSTAFAELLSSFAADPELAEHSFRSPRFSARYRELAADEAVAQRLAALDPSTTIGDVAAAALTLYRATGDFFALHTVTASHAARLISEQLGSEQLRRQLALSLAHAVALGYLALDTPPFAANQALDDLPAWADIVAFAISDDDEHVIKLVHSCVAEHAAYGSEGYRHAAAIVCGLSPLAALNP